MPFTERDITCREIITKAVCAKGRQYSQATHTITPSHSPTSILGCWIINHSSSSNKVGDAVEVSGSYDINMWYSYNNNTKTDVKTETINYTTHVPLTIIDKHCLDSPIEEVYTKSVQQPTASEATISETGNTVLIQVEWEVLVEVVGETKVCVMICADGCEEDEKDFVLEEELGDEFEELDPEIIIDDLD